MRFPASLHGDWWHQQWAFFDKSDICLCVLCPGSWMKISLCYLNISLECELCWNYVIQTLTIVCTYSIVPVITSTFSKGNYPMIRTVGQFNKEGTPWKKNSTVWFPWTFLWPIDMNYFMQRVFDRKLSNLILAGTLMDSTCECDSLLWLASFIKPLTKMEGSLMFTVQLEWDGPLLLQYASNIWSFHCWQQRQLFPDFCSFSLGFSLEDFRWSPGRVWSNNFSNDLT